LWFEVPVVAEEWVHAVTGACGGDGGLVHFPGESPTRLGFSFVLGVRSGPTALGLLEDVLLRSFEFHREVRLDVVGVQDGVDAGVNLVFRAECYGRS